MNKRDDKSSDRASSSLSGDLLQLQNKEKENSRFDESELKNLNKYRSYANMKAAFRKNNMDIESSDRASSLLSKDLNQLQLQNKEKENSRFDESELKNLNKYRSYANMMASRKKMDEY